MAANSSIEWTEATWNPVTGCTRASRGCDLCYAVRMTKRLAEMGQEKYQGLVNPGKAHFNGLIKTHPDTLAIPLRRRKPTTYFVNSMSDLFHRDVSSAFIAAVFGAMAASPQHTYQVLTKRPERIAPFYEWLDLKAQQRGLTTLELCVKALNHYAGVEIEDGASEQWPLPNVWLGTSVEDEDAARTRVPALTDAPATVHFLSCEPLLGPLDHLSLTSIDWVIVGGESGPGARPMEEDWVLSIKAQCEQAGVAFFFKQWGGVNKKQTGRKLGGVTYDDAPEQAPGTPAILSFA